MMAVTRRRDATHASINMWGSIAGILLAAIVSPFAFRGEARLRYLAWPYGAIMLLNGAQHIAASIWFGKLMPGVLSSPYLLVASTALLVTTFRERRDVHHIAV